MKHVPANSRIGRSLARAKGAVDHRESDNAEIRRWNALVEVNRARKKAGLPPLTELPKE